ncbi:MAG: 50S ribosomal protein L19 [Oscillospiraceae bacterium]|nr:50S ribosomal protein L19 [Oscillospiraceae bacterium]
MNEISESSLRKIPYKFGIGDTVVVDINVTEGTKSRIQIFEGVVIAKKGHGIAESFTLRKVSYGVGVERIFLVNSLNLRSLKVIRKGKVRRSKLYYLRNRIGKYAKVKERLS